MILAKDKTRSTKLSKHTNKRTEGTALPLSFILPYGRLVLIPILTVHFFAEILQPKVINFSNCTRE